MKLMASLCLLGGGQGELFGKTVAINVTDSNSDNCNYKYTDNISLSNGSNEITLASTVCTDPVATISGNIDSPTNVYSSLTFQSTGVTGSSNTAGKITLSGFNAWSEGSILNGAQVEVSSIYSFPSSGGVTLNQGSYGGSILVFNVPSADGYALTSTVNGDGTGYIKAVGDGTLHLSGTISDIYQLTCTAGTLNVSGSCTVDSVAVSGGSVNISAFSNLSSITISGGELTISGESLGSSITMSGGELTISGSSTSAVFSFENTGNEITAKVTGYLNGTVGLTLSSTGFSSGDTIPSLILSAENIYEGKTVIGGNTELIIGSEGQIGINPIDIWVEPLGILTNQGVIDSVSITMGAPSSFTNEGAVYFDDNFIVHGMLNNNNTIAANGIGSIEISGVVSDDTIYYGIINNNNAGYISGSKTWVQKSNAPH